MKYLFLFFSLASFGQLTVEKIMADPNWIGTSPTNIQWAEDGKNIYFNWNPDATKVDSMYKYNLESRKIEKLKKAEREALSAFGVYNKDFSKKLYAKNGDLFLLDCKTMALKPLTQTIDIESNPSFSLDEKTIFFVRNQNYFSMSLADGFLKQITNFAAGSLKVDAKPTDQENWLKKDQLGMMDVLKERKALKDATPKEVKQKTIYLDDKTLDQLVIDPTGSFVCYRLTTQPKNAKNTIVPAYVTESGFTEDLRARTKVGGPQATSQSYLYHTKLDTAFSVSTATLPGILDKPDFYKDYKQLDTVKTKARPVVINGPIFSENAKTALLNIRSADNKDRWLAVLDLKTAKLTPIDRQRDEAWVAGPGIGFNFSMGNTGFINDSTVYFQSEESGYSHLYTFDLTKKTKTALTRGNFEIQSAVLSKDKQTFLIVANKTHPGEQHIFQLDINSKNLKQLTSNTGGYEAYISPDGQNLAYRFSTATQPWELYLGSLENAAKAEKITNSTTAAFKAQPWATPKYVSFQASDGQEVFARLYEPKSKKNKKAVVFVHGAGYLQNAHKWWSQYFREYMFHNLLIEKGYTVLDIDYRGSAGYGRNVRTGIYRHMGGKDLRDHIDAAAYLTKTQGIDPAKIGIYGGSYGGFITLMAMFNTPGTFKAGAALRPVTDWAAYNHGYTANILNEPTLDSIAYKRSSPIYFANGLKDHLLICHGMVDVNVHFQDVVRLQQRLIELGKNNWELAAYPLEDHGFVEASSWIDEYKRILKLFEEKL